MPLQQQSVLQPLLWAEFTSKQGSLFNGSFSWTAPSQVVHVLDFALGDGTEWTDLTEALNKLLGTAYIKTENGTKKIVRELPMRHPAIESFWCVGVANAQFVGPADKSEENFGPIATHSVARLTCVFGNLNYAVLDDEENQRINSGNEWMRYVSFDQRPTSEAIQRIAGNMAFTEGGGGISGNVIPYGIPQIVNKNEIRLTWHKVPESFIFTSDLVATNIIACVNKTNSTTFMGRPAGTLLMMPPTFKEQTAPFPLASTPAYKPQRLWQVDIVLKEFDPPYGATGRGHNLLPHPTNGYWYKAAAKDDATKFLYGETDFATAFTGV